MFDDSCFLNEVTDFRKLGTGHKRKKVFAVDPNRRILFLASVFQNRPFTIGKVRFDNKCSFDLKSRTIGNQKVSLFLHTEELARRWRWQCEIERVNRWMETARAEDVIVFADFVAEESGMPKSGHHPLAVILAKLEIENRLRELGFVQLQRLTAMLYPVCERIAA
jgi:hypothetical protein